MVSVPPAAPDDRSPSGPFVVCPICGSLGKEPVIFIDENIRTASAICPNQHIWLVKWWELAS